jgi:uncharacterized protein YwbE
LPFASSHPIATGAAGLALPLAVAEAVSLADGLVSAADGLAVAVGVALAAGALAAGVVDDALPASSSSPHAVRVNGTETASATSLIRAERGMDATSKCCVERALR